MKDLSTYILGYGWGLGFIYGMYEPLVLTFPKHDQRQHIKRIQHIQDTFLGQVVAAPVSVRDKRPKA